MSRDLLMMSRCRNKIKNGQSLIAKIADKSCKGINPIFMYSVVK